MSAKVYKISSSVMNGIYIGSTKKTLNERYSGHMSNYRSYLKHNKNFYTVFNIFNHGVEHCKIELLEEFPFTSNKALFERERYYINILNSVNKYIPNRTYQEYCFDHKDDIKIRKRIYYINNKEKIKQHYKDNKINTKQLVINIKLTINNINK